MITWSLHLSTMFQRLVVRDRPDAAAAAGASAVDTWWITSADRDVWAESVARSGVKVALLNCDCGDVPGGERGFLNRSARRDEVVSSFRDAVALATRVGATRINLLAGIAVAGVPRTEQLAHVADVLRELIEVDRNDVALVLEPVNDIDVPGSVIADAQTAFDVIEQVGGSDVGLLYDVYHVAMMGADVFAELRDHAELIGHVHYADYPGRGAPGTGRIDLAKVAETLEDTGYDGAVGLEYVSMSDQPLDDLRRRGLC